MRDASRTEAVLKDQALFNFSFEKILIFSSLGKYTSEKKTDHAGIDQFIIRGSMSRETTTREKIMQQSINWERTMRESIFGERTLRASIMGERTIWELIIRERTMLESITRESTMRDRGPFGNRSSGRGPFGNQSFGKRTMRVGGWIMGARGA